MKTLTKERLKRIKKLNEEKLRKKEMREPINK